ncbi:MAG: hypothetical protein WAL71_03200, partial [Terriglobales bacterium]
RSTVPGINIYQKGHWSKAGLLVEGPKDCAPLWSWCHGKELNLLVTYKSGSKCTHLVVNRGQKGNHFRGIQGYQNGLPGEVKRGISPAFQEEPAGCGDRHVA